MAERTTTGSRITGNIENRKKYVTQDQIQQVWNWLNDNPTFGAGGTVKVRKRIETGFKTLDVCINGVHAEAIIEKGIDLGWFKKDKERLTNGTMEQVVLAVPMKELEKAPEPKQEPVNEVAFESPARSWVEFPEPEPVTPEPAKEPAKPEAILKACASITLNDVTYLSEADVHEAVRILVEDLACSNPTEGFIRNDIHDAEVESLERIIESNAATRNDLQATIGKLERKLADAKDALNKVTESRDSWQKDCEKHKNEAISLRPFLTFHAKEYRVSGDGTPDPLITIVGKVKMTAQFPEKLMKLADTVLRGTELNLSRSKRR